MNAGYINVACVITTWRLGLRAPLVARNYISKECRLIYPSHAYKLNKVGKTRQVARCVLSIKLQSQKGSSQIISGDNLLARSVRKHLVIVA